MWVDSHCHLHHDQIPAADVPLIVARAQQAGVTTMLTVATTLADTRKIIPLLETYDSLLGSVGIHPHETEHVQADLTSGLLAQKMRHDLTCHPKMVALGETGLDFYYGHSSADAQSACFHLHLELAIELDLPVIIHSRNAEAETIAHLKRYQGKVRGVVHCFTGSEYFAQEALDLGLYLSCSGILSFPKSTALRETFAQIPLSRLLIETDTPYLAPVPHRGQPNEPSYMVQTGQVIAELFGTSPENIALQTTQNFWHWIGKTPSPTTHGL